MKKMTDGSPARLILAFAIPLLIGNVFQQLYSMADMYIVGHTISADALGAIGCTGSISGLLISFAQGLTSGFCVILAQHFGAGRRNEMRTSFITGIMLSVACIVLLTAIGCTFLDKFMKLINTREELFDDAYRYISVIVAGMGATIMYNLFAGILRALGDSRRPLYVLIGSCIVNIALDYVLILGFGMGVRGAALATVISQLLSAGACLVFILRMEPVFRIKLNEFRTTRKVTREHMLIGLPMGFQWSMISIGQLVMQSALNGLSVAAVTAFSAAAKVDMLAVMPSFSFGSSMSTYVAQNYGAGKLDRIGKGMRQCCAISLSVCFAIGVICVCFGDKLAGFFVGRAEEEVIGLIHTYLKINGSMYFMHATIMIFRNAVQGLGRSFATMMAGFMELAMRFVTAWVLIRFWGFTGACFSSPLSWIAGAAPLIISFVLTRKRLRREEEEKEAVTA